MLLYSVLNALSALTGKFSTFGTFLLRNYTRFGNVRETNILNSGSYQIYPVSDRKTFRCGFFAFFLLMNMSVVCMYA